MTVRKVLFIHGTAGTPNYPAEDVRAMYAAVFGGDLYGAVSPGVGAIARAHGVLRNGLLVTPNGTPNLTVHVGTGLAVVRGTQENDQGAYVFGNDADVTLTITPDGSNPRNVLILAKVRDAQYPAHTGDDGILEALHGTPAGSPVDPTVPEDALVLARVVVGAGDTAITAGEITNLAPEIVATGGIQPVNALTEIISPRDGDAAWVRATNRLHVYTGAAWGIPYPLGRVAEASSSGTSAALNPTNTIFELPSTDITVTNTDGVTRRYQAVVTARFNMASGTNGLYRPLVTDGANNALGDTQTQLFTNVAGGPGQVGGKQVYEFTLAASASQNLAAGGTRLSAGSATDVIESGNIRVYDLGPA